MAGQRCAIRSRFAARCVVCVFPELPLPCYELARLDQYVVGDRHLADVVKFRSPTKVFDRLHCDAESQS